MFIEKTTDELAKMTPTELDAYKAELKAHNIKVQNDAIEKEVAEKVDAAKIEIAKTIDSEVAKQVADKMNASMPNKPTTMLDAVKEAKDDIIGLVKGSTQSEIVLKADTVRASIANSASQNMLTDIGQLGTIKRGLYDIFPKVQLGNGNDAGKVVYHDWDEATTVRAAAMVAEGGTFPESTAKFEKYSIELKKIGDTLPVSEEFGEDEASAAAELEMFLDTNVQSKIDSQVALGLGAGNELTGLVASAPAYTAVASALADANIYDLVKKVRTDIVKTRGSKYAPNFVAMNANVIDQLQLKKDANDNYIFPDKTNIGSMIIVEDNNLADNTLIVGDSRFARIYEKGGVELSRVYVNAQAVEDMVTIKARKRLLLLIRNVDKTGFRKVTSISAALTTLAS